MFHFLVKYDGWAQARDTIARERVFEYTDDTIVAQYKPDGNLNIERIMALPALFVSETSGTGDQRGRVGSIARVLISNKEIHLEYAFEDGIPSIANSTLEKLSTELRIGSWELSRTHWSIKDVDLFRVLLQNKAGTSPSPKVFKLNDLEEIDDALLSVMMPFNARFDSLYTTIQAVAKGLKMQCLRADDIWDNDAIIQDVVSLIKRSRIIVCDCTGRNANVFYEVGIAHTLGRDVILITQSEGDIPFDLRHLRYVIYLNNGEGREQLANRLKKRIQTLKATC